MKDQLILSYRTKIQSYLENAQLSINPYPLSVDLGGFTDAIKGKRNLKSMDEALDAVKELSDCSAKLADRAAADQTAELAESARSDLIA